MNDDKLMFLAVLIAVELGARGGAAPSGHVYARMMNEAELDEYETALALGRHLGFWTVAKSLIVSLTQDGLVLANRAVRLVQQAEAKRD